MVNGRGVMIMELDENFLYVINSLRRIDVMYVLSSVEFARNYEIADILCITTGRASAITKELLDHDLITFVTFNNHRLYSLTQKGEEIVKKLKDYHGTN